MSLQFLDQLSIGLVLVDRHAKILFANALAKEIARVEGPFQSRYLLADSCTPKLQAFVRRALSSARLRAVNLEQDGRTVIALVSPLAVALSTPTTSPSPPAGLVILVDLHRAQQMPISWLIDAFALTNAEARIAAAMSSGASIVETARTLRLSPNTVKTHLRRVYEKTGTTRQAQLCRLIAIMELANNYDLTR